MVTFIIGVIWAMIYIIGKYRSDTNGFLLVYFVHLGTNVFTVFYNQFMN